MQAEEARWLTQLGKENAGAQRHETVVAANKASSASDQQLSQGALNGVTSMDSTIDPGQCQLAELLRQHLC